MVELAAVLERAGDDQRRAASSIRIEIHFVDDREIVPALDHLGDFVLHVVAQVVEAVLVVGAVGDVACIGAGVHPGRAR